MRLNNILVADVASGHATRTAVMSCSLRHNFFNKRVSISQIGAFFLYRTRYKPPHVSLKTFFVQIRGFSYKFRCFSFFPMQFPKMFHKNTEVETQQEEQTGFSEGTFKENVHLKP